MHDVQLTHKHIKYGHRENELGLIESERVLSIRIETKSTVSSCLIGCCIPNISKLVSLAKSGLVDVVEEARTWKGVQGKFASRVQPRPHPR
jgi:hypothetical protein